MVDRHVLELFLDLLDHSLKRVVRHDGDRRGRPPSLARAVPARSPVGAAGAISARSRQPNDERSKSSSHEIQSIEHDTNYP